MISPPLRRGETRGGGGMLFPFERQKIKRVCETKIVIWGKKQTYAVSMNFYNFEMFLQQPVNTSLGDLSCAPQIFNSSMFLQQFYFPANYKHLTSIDLASLALCNAEATISEHVGAS